ncbi:MAG: hypothetical protein IJT30_10415 [Muribaculaceae bacterium]|nr:hypothetical protein [Muribaculaceae bacterium]
MRKVLFLFLAVLFCFQTQAQDIINGDDDEQQILITQTNAPKPHRLIDEPEVCYNTVMGSLVFYFDTSCYIEYTITLSSDYASLDYYVTTPVVTFPAYMLGDVTDIYIDSDVVAGSNVDSGRTAGNVTIKKGVDYEIECKGSVTLKPGFTVEKGATFSVKASDY